MKKILYVEKINSGVHKINSSLAIEYKYCWKISNNFINSIESAIWVEWEGIKM